MYWVEHNNRLYNVSLIGYIGELDKQGGFYYTIAGKLYKSSSKELRNKFVEAIDNARDYGKNPTCVVVAAKGKVVK